MSAAPSWAQVEKAYKLQLPNAAMVSRCELYAALRARNALWAGSAPEAVRAEAERLARVVGGGEWITDSDSRTIGAFALAMLKVAAHKTETKAKRRKV